MRVMGEYRFALGDLSTSLEMTVHFITTTKFALADLIHLPMEGFIHAVDFIA